MPFKSKSQRRACWAQYHRDVKAGRKPAWDCYEWESKTTDKSLPEYLPKKKAVAKRPLKSKSKKVTKSKTKRMRKSKKGSIRKSKKASLRKSKQSSSYARLSPKKDRKRKVHIGSRGGKYVVIKGRKIYV